MRDGSNAPIVIVLLLGAVAAGAFFWWKKQQTPPPPPPPVAAPVVPVAPPPPPPPDAAPAIRHPVEPAAPPKPLPDLASADQYVKDVLLDLLGRRGVATFLHLDGFVRRCVATVDNLAGPSAPITLWPVKPTAGTFLTQTSADGTIIGNRNAARYTTFVRFVEKIDIGNATAVYFRLYPLFQQAYEELGHPGQYFNDRVVEVIDHLLETPDIAGPIKVKVIEVMGKPAPGEIRYQYDDPAVESRSAGQRTLLRMGPDNAAKLKAKLREIRGRITRGPSGR